MDISGESKCRFYYKVKNQILGFFNIKSNESNWDSNSKEIKVGISKYKGKVSFVTIKVGISTNATIFYILISRNF